MPHERIHRVHVGSGWRLLLRDLGLDEVSILRRCGQPQTLFHGEGTHLSIDAYFALFDAIETEAGGTTVALRAGQIVSVEFFDPAIFAAICSPDMNTAASRLGQFKRLVGQFSWDVHAGREATDVRFRCKHRPDLPAILSLSEVVFLVAFARRATRERIIPRRVRVQGAPTQLAPFTEYFGCEVEVGDATAVSFSAADAERPFLTHNVPMWQAFEPELRRRMAEAHEQRTVAESVETALFELLPSGRTQMRDVAKELGIGSRTLQRRLAAEGTTWLELLNGTRERLARHYLTRTQMSPKEVAFLLGFEDPNSLYRAFHRWTVRRRNLGGLGSHPPSEGSGHGPPARPQTSNICTSSSWLIGGGVRPMCQLVCRR